MSEEDHAESKKVIASIFQTIKNHPEFDTRDLVINTTDNSIELHTRIANFKKLVSTSKSNKSPKRIEFIEGPCRDGYKLKLWYRNYKAIIQLAANQYLLEPYGKTFYGLIRPSNQHYEIAFTFSFACDPVTLDHDPEKGLPAIQKMRLSHLISLIKQTVGDTEQDAYSPIHGLPN